VANLKIKYKNPCDLTGYKRNARVHSDEQIDQIVNSMQEFGFTNPVLVDENDEIIAGHGRIAAATKLGLNSVPTITLEGLSESQKKALRIADNQLALNSKWDMDLLAAELPELQDADFDLALLGFDDKFLDDLLQVDEPPVEDPPEKPDPTKKIEIILGPYKFKIPAAEFSRWEAAIRANVGFDVANIETEIKKRLQL
jgi:ParB family chromosome partitioning protein